MTEATTPDNITKWTISDGASLVQMSQAMGDSIQVALDKRQRYEFVWQDAADRDAQTDMVEGSKGYQIDTETDWIYDGANWRLHSLLMQPFTPTFINFTLGNGTRNGFLTISAGWASVFVTVTMGSTSSMGTDMYIVAPADAPVSHTLSAQGSIKLGFCNFEDVSAGAAGRFEGTALLSVNPGGTPYPDGVFRIGAISGSPASFLNTTSTTPFTWATGDKVHLNVNYPVE